ncbi:DNA-processing protein DprA [Peribacillus kribbensis]|uniref:DNA-processing protein DprA n=1 Tax=Peribacillus kribbensis TaxID=356658 RepID=UPI00040D932D|nr:DNA-processing protein DprA [Peribacillus kribbensis]
MEDFNIRLIHLDHCRGIGWKSIFRILQLDPSLSRIYENSPAHWQSLLQITRAHAAQFYEDLHQNVISPSLDKYKSHGIQCLTIADPDYPAALKNIYNPPWVLYMKGDVSLFNEGKHLAVVGPRKPSLYGLDSVKRLLVPLIKKGYIINSGLAAGIDAAAHKIALDHAGRTIAVLGGGLFHVYPKENGMLAQSIMKNGAVISEYAPSKKAEPWMFPQRNRIISGISKAVLVIEAKERSGSLITAYSALEQGRDVFSVPGNITSCLSAGTNRLIQEGAKPIVTHLDIEEEYPD